MNTIFITEKPSVAQEYAKILKVQRDGEKSDGRISGRSPVLGKNVIITWAVGHLIAISPPEEQNPEWGGRWSQAKLPMIPERFKYYVLPDTKKQFDVIKSLYLSKETEAIYYAGDSGREGIYIQALIRNQIFKTEPKADEKVVWIDSYTEKAVLDGIRNAKPYADYRSIIDAGYGRAISDWIIGMNLTECFTLKTRKLIKVGRVMTPTLAMVVKRQEEIDGFVKTPYFGIKAELGDGCAAWKAVKGSRFHESPLLYNETGFLRRSDAESLLNGLNGDPKLTVCGVKVQKKTEYAPYLFNLADLQAYCSKNYRISPAQALSIAQSLYEKKLTTYPRTDARFLSSAVAAELKAQGYDVPERYVDDGRITDHYAIIPTFNGDPSSLTGLEEAVYKAVLKRFTDTMKPPYVYNAVSVDYEHRSGEHFFESYRQPVQAGFKNISEDGEAVRKEPPVKGTSVNVSAFGITENETKPPAAYTTGSLILAMEKAGRLIEDEELREQIKTSGIGTSATRAGIIEKLAAPDRNGVSFITIDRNQKVAPTEFGRAVIPQVAAFDEKLISPEKTAEMESGLSDVAAGRLALDAYLAAVKKQVRDTVAAVLNGTAASFADMRGTSSEYKCPHCGGRVSRGRFGWYCQEKCGFSPMKVYGHELTDGQITALLSGREASFSVKGRKTVVLPEVTPNEWNGRTYYNWKVRKKD